MVLDVWLEKFCAGIRVIRVICLCAVELKVCVCVLIVFARYDLCPVVCFVVSCLLVWCLGSSQQFVCIVCVLVFMERCDVFSGVV